MQPPTPDGSECSTQHPRFLVNAKLLVTSALMLGALVTAPAANALEIFSNDDGLSFAINGYAQPYFRWVDNPCTYDAGGGACGEQRVAADGFGLSRGRISFEGDYQERGSFKLELRTIPNAQLLEARLDFRPLPWLQVTAGRFKVPFSRQELTSESRLQLVDRAAFISGTPGRQLGVAVQAQFGIGETADDLITLSGGVFNGESAKEQAPVNNIDEDFLYAARLEIAPFGQPAYAEGDLRSPSERRQASLVFGAGWTYNTVGEDVGDYEQRNVGGDVAFMWQGLSLYGEVFRRDRNYNNDDLNVDQAGFGYNIQAGYFIPAPYLRDHLEIAGRVEEWDPQRAHNAEDDAAVRPFNSGTGPANSSGTQASRNYVAGLNWYFFGHDLKLQANYTHRQALEHSALSIDNPDVPLDTNDDTFYLQLTMRF